jgi:hypothetical protein
LGLPYLSVLYNCRLPHSHLSVLYNCRLPHLYAYDNSTLPYSTFVLLCLSALFRALLLFHHTCPYSTKLYCHFKYLSVLFRTILLFTVRVRMRQHFSSIHYCRLSFLPVLCDCRSPYSTNTTTVLFRTLLMFTVLVSIRRQYSSVLYCCLSYSYAYDKQYSSVLYWCSPYS